MAGLTPLHIDPTTGIFSELPLQLEENDDLQFNLPIAFQTAATVPTTTTSVYDLVLDPTNNTIDKRAHTLLTNGQINIGSTGVNSVAATLTGTANQIAVTNGAGSITLGFPATGAAPTTGSTSLATTYAAAGSLASITSTHATLNCKVGTLIYTGISTISGSATDTLTIVNTSAGTNGLVNLVPVVTAAASNPVITNVVWTAGTGMVITVTNASGTATGSSGAFTFNWVSFN